MLSLRALCPRGARPCSWGPLNRKILGNGCFTYFSYDAANRRTQILNGLSDGAPLAYFEYTYDPAGRITKVLREDGNVIYYGYDNADRLTSKDWYDSGMSQLYAFEWDCDAVGNRTYQKRGTQETYYTHDACNALTESHEIPADTWSYFHYDSAGNCIRIESPNGTTYFTHNALNLMTSVKFRTGVMNYFYYDARQRRYAVHESTGTTYFTHDSDGLCTLVERDADGVVTAEYARGYAPTDGIGDVAAARIYAGGTAYYQYPVSLLSG